MANGDLARLINSDEIQSVVGPLKTNKVRRGRVYVRACVCVCVYVRARESIVCVCVCVCVCGLGWAGHAGWELFLPRPSRARSPPLPAPPRPARPQVRKPLKKNPLRNLGALLKLNPYAKNARRGELLAAAKRAAAKEEKLAAARAAKAAGRPAVKKVSKAFYSTMITDSGGCRQGVLAGLGGAGRGKRKRGAGVCNAGDAGRRERKRGAGRGRGCWLAGWLAGWLLGEFCAGAGEGAVCWQHAGLPARRWPDPASLPRLPLLAPCLADYVGQDYEVFSQWLGQGQ